MCACPPPSDLEILLKELNKFATDIKKHQTLFEISRKNFYNQFKILNRFAPEVYREFSAVYAEPEPEPETIDVEFEYV